MSEIKESAEDEVREVTRGRRWYTPFTVIGSVAALVWGVAAVVIAVTLVVWLLL